MAERRMGFCEVAVEAILGCQGGGSTRAVAWQRMAVYIGHHTEARGLIALGARLPLAFGELALGGLCASRIRCAKWNAAHGLYMDGDGWSLVILRTHVRVIGEGGAWSELFTKNGIFWNS